MFIFLVLGVVLTTLIGLDASAVTMKTKTAAKRKVFQMCFGVGISQISLRRSRTMNAPEQTSAWSGDPNEPCSSWEQEPEAAQIEPELNSEPILDLCNDVELGELFLSLSFSWFEPSEISSLTSSQIGVYASWLAGISVRFFSLAHAFNLNQVFDSTASLNTTPCFWLDTSSGGYDSDGHVFVKCTILPSGTISITQGVQVQFTSDSKRGFFGFN